MIDEAWRDLEANHRSMTFDDLAHGLLDALSSEPIAPDGLKRLLLAIWPNASDEEREAATGVAVTAHAKTKRHCVCCDYYCDGADDQEAA